MPNENRNPQEPKHVGQGRGAQRPGAASAEDGNPKGRKVARQQGASGTIDQKGAQTGRDLDAAGPRATRHVEGGGPRGLRQGTPETEDLEG